MSLSKPLAGRVSSLLLWSTMCLLSLTACQGAGQATPTATAVPTARPSSTPAVIVIALDGARPDWLIAMSKAGIMPTVTELVAQGSSAGYLQSIDPPLLLPTYLSLSTGLLPSQTGMVSNRFNTPQVGFAEHVDSIRSLGVYPEPIWRTAMRNGLTTATIGWPAADPGVASLGADYMLAIGESDGPPARHILTLSEAEGWSSAPPSFSPPQQAVLTVTSAQSSTLATLNLLLLDTHDDDSALYDVALLDHDKELSNGYHEVPLSQWGAVEISPRLHSGAYFCLTASSGVTVALYQSQVCYLQARPAEFLTTTYSTFGFPPPPPDLHALGAGWIAPQQYYELAEERSRWIMGIAAWVKDRYKPDLLLTAPTVLADCARAFLLTDERQPGHTPELEQQYASYIERGHALADELVAALLAGVDRSRTIVMVLSTHGYLPVFGAIRPNTLLQNAGLLRLYAVGQEDYVNATTSKAIAYAAEGSAHIYVNLKGRQQPGVVEAEDYAKVVKQIVDLLSQAKDADETPLFERIITQDELRAIGLGSPNDGDVFVQAKPGYTITDILGYRSSIVAANYLGAAGFNASLPEMRGVFVMAGGTVPAGTVIPSVHLLDVTPTIARALGIHLPSKVVGRSLQDLWEQD